jgi:oxygen-dependent protoporphyrinogen oxidase
VVIIIGGGITGLAAAFELTQRGVPFALLEASGRPGGLIVTEHVDGWVIDGGPDSMLAQKPAAIDLCRDVGLSRRLISTTPPRTAFVLKDHRLYPLPSPSILGIPTTAAGLARYHLLPGSARARMALEPLVPRRAFADESVAAFFRRRFGGTTVGLIAEPLLGGIHAGDVERLSMRSLFPRLVEAERKPGRVLMNLRGRAGHDSDGAFRSLRGGMGELVHALAAALPPGAMQLHSPAAAIRRTGAGWKVSHAGGGTDAAAVILAAPSHAVASLIAPVDAGAAQLCREVPYVSTASVALGWSRSDIPHTLSGSGFVVARRYCALRITACTWVSAKWEGRAPPGYALIRAFLGGFHDPAAAELTDDELIQTAAGDVSSVLGIRAAPLLARIFRWRNAGAQHNVGHRARIAGLLSRLRAHPGLFVAGSGFESIGIPDCVAHGRRAAAAAADYVTIGR